MTEDFDTILEKERKFKTLDMNTVMFDPNSKPYIVKKTLIDSMLEKEKAGQTKKWSELVSFNGGEAVVPCHVAEAMRQSPVFDVTKRNPMPKPVFTPQRTQAGWDLNRATYRKLRDRAGICYDPRIVLAEYTIAGYMGGGEELKANGLTFDHFDAIAFICTSMHPKKQQERHHFTGSRDGVVTILNCLKIK